MSRTTSDAAARPVVSRALAQVTSALSSGGLLFAGTFLGALLGYAFFVVLGRSMTPDDLGAVGSLINLSTILTVPGLGLQLVTARGVASQSAPAHGRSGGPVDGGLLVGALLVGGVPALLLAVTAPLVAPLLHLPSVAPLVVLALSAVPMTVAFAALGVLQGAERFAALGLSALLVGVAKIASAVAASALGQGVLGVIGWYAVGWVVVAVVAGALAVRGAGRGGAGEDDAGPDGSMTAPSRWAAGIARARAGLVGSMPTAGLLVLSSLDLILARHHLTRDGSGVYTMGALFEKVAFWGPQFIATMYYPRMARPAERRAAVRAAVGVTAAVGVLGVLVAAVAGDLLTSVVGGRAYVDELGHQAWVFTALGVALALVQVLVYADLADHRHGVGALVWVAVAVTVGAVALWHGSVAAVVTTVLVCVLGLLVVAGTVVARRA
ncbi:lipopolysaccharide biosynthesis protein [Arsenicicoccus sp. UBA7492]|uniref:lipopolysaccharide biosynthesis protein n=1 Tax=Arsenicicoccus sp. UBA7492 TaxID=1946057 RepID=UPI00257DE9D1|nr:oligosaccharide flippase family protein [Arsenicicoccus sp. UBA7492]